MRAPLFSLVQTALVDAVTKACLKGIIHRFCVIDRYFDGPNYCFVLRLIMDDQESDVVKSIAPWINEYYGFLYANKEKLSELIPEVINRRSFKKIKSSEPGYKWIDIVFTDRFEIPTSSSVRMKFSVSSLSFLKTVIPIIEEEVTNKWVNVFTDTRRFLITALFGTDDLDVYKKSVIYPGVEPLAPEDILDFDLDKWKTAITLLAALFRTVEVNRTRYSVSGTSTFPTHYSHAICHLTDLIIHQPFTTLHILSFLYKNRDYIIKRLFKLYIT